MLFKGVKCIRGAIVLGAIGAVASVAAEAQAQAVVYGVADAGVVFERGGAAGAVTKVTSGIASGSRIGFKGSEDLGNGLSANFVLEAGISIDTGGGAQGVNVTNLGGVMFGRQALVGIKGDFGSVSLGRQYTPYALLVAGLLDPFATGMAGSAFNIMYSTGLRANNSIVYSSPVLNGFNVDAMYSAGEIAGDTSAGRGLGTSIGYAAGPLNVRLAYFERNSVNPSVVASARNILLGGTYDFTSVKLHVGYATNRGPGSATYLGQGYIAPGIHNPYGSAVPPTPSTNSRDYLIGVTVPFGPHKLLASYINRKDKTSLAQDATQMAIGYSYALSRRTDVYTSVGVINNKNGAGYTVGNNGDVTFGSGDKAYNVGLRHVF